MNKGLMIGLLVLTVSACGGADREDIDPLQTQRQALEKARAVEDVLKDSVERQRRLIDDQDGQ